MNRFGYLRDPLFLVALTAYAMNQWLLKPHLPWPWLHAQANDLLLIPAALPLVLWIQRRMGLRSHDQPPGAGEILTHLVVWSVICEFIGPRWLGHGRGDLWDVAAYAVGGVAAYVGWHRHRFANASLTP